MSDQDDTEFTVLTVYEPDAFVITVSSGTAGTLSGIW